METTTKKLNGVSKQYILDNITSDGYIEEGQKEPSTDKEKLQFLMDTFKSEYGWAIERYGIYKAFTEWLMGLPSVFSIDFMNYDILQLAKKWGSIPENATERQENKILANWWNFITVKTFQLFNKHHIKY